MSRGSPPPWLPEPEAFQVAAEAVSEGWRYYYSPRNLYYEMVRRGDAPPPSSAPAQSKADFRAALETHEREHGPLRSLIHKESMPEGHDPPALDGEIMCYSVRRVLVFDRKDVFLLFALNQFFLQIECALVVMPDSPAHIWSRIEAQFDEGMKMRFFLVHDCNYSGFRLKSRLQGKLGPRRSYRISDCGLRYGQAFRLGIPVLSTPSTTDEEMPKGVRRTDGLMLRHDHYAHLEQLPPLALMRWAYRRVAGRIGGE